MWPIISLSRSLRSTSLFKSVFDASRSTTNLFHSLSGASKIQGSPLANQCSQHALFGRTGTFLQPLTVPLLNLVSGFKVKGRLKRRCKDCYFVVRQQRLYVICKTHPRHKQMAMKKHDRNTWILTDATQSPVRAW